MTREEIIEGLKLLEDNMVYFDELLNDKGEYIDVHELLFEAIEALEQEPCDDAISRQAMHIELEKWITYGEYKYSNATKYLYDRIDRLPLVTPKPKTGHWIDHQEGRWIYAKCSECGTVHDTQTNYCPNCGVKMESEGKK